MKKQLFALLFSLNTLCGFSQFNLVIDPTDRLQTMEGWGVSLAWWANIAGKWSNADIDTLCTWLTSPTGLNMNIFRFNIGAEENPSHNHLGYGANLQGYKTTEFGSYDYTRDSTQRKILLKLKSKRSDCIFEAIAYSPPYWMTVSGCTSGDTTDTDNLDSDYFDDFADYLTNVVKYYHDSLGVTFRTLNPTNEPNSGWWVKLSRFVGCNYTPSKQRAIITEVYNKLVSKSMLGYCTVSSLDATDGIKTISGINDLVSNNMMSKITQINTHAYTVIDSVGQYRKVYDTAQKYEKRLWQTETGPLGLGAGTSNDGFANNLYMTDALIRDMKNLRPVAWCDWQYGDFGTVWSHIQYDSNATYSKIPNYYNRTQVSRFIKPGYTIINSNNRNTLAAINASNDTVVLVINNSSLNDSTYKINLNLFSAAGAAAEVYRTSTGMDAGHYYASNYKVLTYQTVTGLTNGTYTAKAWVRSGGGQTQCYFKASGYGGSTLTANIPRSMQWVQLTISNITVTNGQCTIGFYSDAPKNTWCEFDDVQLYANSSPSTNFVVNYNFENTNAFADSIPGWSSSDSIAADFIQSLSHSNNEECTKLSNISISSNALSFTANKKSISTLIIPVTSASGAPIASGNYEIKAKHSDKDMSVYGWSTSDAGAIVQYEPADQGNQVFNVEWTSSGYKLLPSYNPKAVSIHYSSTDNGAVAEQYTDLEQLNQRFSIISVGGGYYKIVAKHSGKCLAVSGNSMADGAAVVQWEWLNGYENFMWEFISVPLSSPLADGTYTIKAKHSNKVMSIDGASNSNGAIVMQWTDACESNQKFNVDFTSAGYTINPFYNDKVVSVNNYSIANGAGVSQWENLSQQNQLYEIVDLGGGYYKIVSRFTNKCLAVSGYGMADGVPIIQWEWLTDDNFKWSFETPCTSPRPAETTTSTDRNPGEVSIMISPNPATSFINVHYPGIDNAQVQILDMTGRLRFTQRAIGSHTVINLGGVLAKGTYLVRIAGTNKTVVKKLIVQ